MPKLPPTPPLVAALRQARAILESLRGKNRDEVEDLIEAMTKKLEGK